jgi:hypothetical protein
LDRGLGALLVMLLPICCDVPHAGLSRKIIQTSVTLPFVQTKFLNCVATAQFQAFTILHLG